MGGVGSDSIRGTFLEFFEQRDHRRIPGTSTIPQGDPTLLFINSGMAPLKKFFTGEEKPSHPDLCNIQACIRTRDIDDVGDRHHLTFFEMLGSWSIGNYFKQRAIELAFELLVDQYSFDPRRLYVTVFSGDSVRGLPADEESAVIWESIGIPRSQLVPLPAADNFWGPAGDSGPCGPCTEVFLDTGEEYGPAYQPGAEFDTTRRYIEVWNAGVFMQFDKGLDGSFTPLPFASVDTGSGLERMEMTLNGFDTVYQCDVLAPTVAAVQDVLGERGDVARHHRLIADHLRATTLILSDGVGPSNEGRGYIPRRLLRKCVTAALVRGSAIPDFSPVVESVVARLGQYYPRMRSGQDEILSAVRVECAEFGGTVRRGLDRLDAVISRKGMLTGSDAFNLFTTYGLPVEIARDLAVERGVPVDVGDFESEFRRHQQTSRGRVEHGASVRPLKIGDVLPAALATLPQTEFLGYEELDAEAKVLALFVNGGLVDSADAEADPVDLIVDRTPCYPEGGGQVGDTGSVAGQDGEGRILTTVTHASGRYLHRLRLERGQLHVGDSVRLCVDRDARARTAANHSATHLLNAALREVLGKHVVQAGSLVEPERLRFDFTHGKPLATDEILAVERLVNQWILADSDRQVVTMTPDEAKAGGALSLVDENYGDAVRVVSFGEFSKELCGGTHVRRTGNIGSCRIASEQSVASGVRRVNALTRDAAANFSLDQGRLVRDVSRVMGTGPHDLLAAAHRLTERSQRPNSGRAQVGHGLAPRDEFRATVAGTEVYVARVDVPVGEVRAHAQNLAAQTSQIVLLWTVAETGKASLVVAVPESSVDRFDATKLLGQLTARLGGSGGGNASLAQGGLPESERGAKIGPLVVEIIDADQENAARV